MDYFEFEGKELLQRYGIPTPSGSLLVSDRDPAPLPLPFVLKAQVLTGGRGKAGGIRICRNEEEYRQLAKEILSMEIRGHRVHGLLAEELVRADREYYLSLTLQGVGVPTLIVSRMGGMDIEQVSREHPEEILRMEVDPFIGLKEYQKRQISECLADADMADLDRLLGRLQAAFFENGALLIEMNPLGLVDGRLIAMDAKVVLDDHDPASEMLRTEREAGRTALYRYIAPEKEKTTITFVPLDGDVAMISDGAGTGMLTLDLLTDAGLRVASFCELGGMTSCEVMYRAMELSLKGKTGIKALIVILIGGFNRMDNMARGITAYCREHNVRIPVFCRMCGTMQEEGIQIMRENGLETYDLLSETVAETAKAVKEGEACRS